MIRARNTKTKATRGRPRGSRDTKARSRSTAKQCSSKSATKSASPLDLRKELTRINKAEKANKGEIDLATMAMGCTKRHNSLKCEVLRDYVDCLSTKPDAWGMLLVPCKFIDIAGDEVEIPRIFSVLAGEVTNEKVAIANKSLVTWQAMTKKKSTSKQSQQLPWYQPVTQSQRLRTFFSTCQQQYRWQLSIDDFNSSGQLGPFMSSLFEERRLQYGHLGYAQSNKKRRLDEASMQMVKLSTFDESVPEQHQMKILFGCGIHLGMRGNSEHTELQVANIQKGKFPVGHSWGGHEYVCIIDTVDKTHKLNLHNTTTRDNSKYMRLPVVQNDPENLAASIVRYLTKLAPNQERLYTQPFQPKAQLKYQQNGGDPMVQYHYNLPLGHNKILQMFREGAEILGLPDAQTFMPHSLRSVFITTLANNPKVSLEEAMRSARHRNADSTAAYIKRSSESESNKFEALGIRKHTVTTLANNPKVSLEEAMRSARHRNADSTAAYIKRSSESESNKFEALGIKKHTDTVTQETDNSNDGTYKIFVYHIRQLTYLPLILLTY